jgi:peptide/nickel transport system substrate-binding protein
VIGLLALALLAAPDTLRIGILADPVALDRPHRATDLVSAEILSNVCEPLVRFRPGSTRPVAALATSWATLDGRSWTFTLRSGVRFHDGTPFDADAVVANLEDLRQERSFPGRAERVGPYLVSIILERPNAALLATLSQAFYGIESPASLGRAARPSGTGPFRFGTVGPGIVELIASRDYWGGAARLARLVFRRVSGPEALLAGLLSGEVDVAASVGLEQVARLRESPEIALESQTGSSLALLTLNNERTPFSDRRVRQALARAVDREALVARVLGGHGVPARNPMPPSLFGYATWTREPIQDRPAARRLLAEAGLPNGFETTLAWADSPRPYMPAPLALAERLREELSGIGVRAQLRRSVSWEEHIERGRRGDYDLMAVGWQADTVDPNDFLSALLASDAIGATNRSRYRSPEMDALLRRGRMATEPDERLALYRQAQELFQRDLPWVPLYHASVFTASRRSVRGLTFGPTGIPSYDKVWRAP